MMTRMMPVAVVVAVLVAGSSTSVALASPMTFSPSPADLYDLSHGRYYTWGIDLDLEDPSQVLVTSATLTFDDIRNWRTETNDLYVHLLDNVTVGTVWATDNSGGDNFSGQGILLEHYHNLPATAQDLVYDFTAADLAVFTAYIQDDGIFGLGFDPDCHFYNNGISLTLTTGQVPEPATVAMLGFGTVTTLAMNRLRRRRQTRR